MVLRVSHADERCLRSRHVAFGHGRVPGSTLPPDLEPDLGCDYSIATVARRNPAPTLLGGLRSAIASRRVQAERYVTISVIDGSLEHTGVKP